MTEIKATKGLKEVREKKKLNQPQMAELLTLLIGKNVSASNYQKWEQGTRPVDPETAVLISARLEVPFNKLFSYDLQDN